MGSIQLHGVRKAFGDVEVIPPLDLAIEDGEFVVFVGPSGCGKSTLLRLIAGLEDTSGGHIEIDGRDATALPPAKRGLAMVFQSYALYPHMSVRKNIEFPLKMAGMEQAEKDRRVNHAASILNLADYIDRRPGQLSGGQRQRVAIGRAIVREPVGLPLRRAALEPRRGAAPRDARRDRRAAQVARDHHGLRHPRPGRGDDDGRQDRGAARGRDRAGRLPARALPRAAQPLRGGLHRLAHDEPDRGARRPRARRAHHRRPPRASRRRRARRAPGPGASACRSIWARTRSCTSTTPALPRRSRCAPPATSTRATATPSTSRREADKLHRFDESGLRLA